MPLRPTASEGAGPNSKGGSYLTCLQLDMACNVTAWHATYRHDAKRVLSPKLKTRDSRGLPTGMDMVAAALSKLFRNFPFNMFEPKIQSLVHHGIREHLTGHQTIQTLGKKSAEAPNLAAKQTVDAGCWSCNLQRPGILPTVADTGCIKTFECLQAPCPWTMGCSNCTAESCKLRKLLGVLTV